MTLWNTDFGLCYTVGLFNIICSNQFMCFFVLFSYSQWSGTGYYQQHRKIILFFLIVYFSKENIFIDLVNKVQRLFYSLGIKRLEKKPSSKSLNVSLCRRKQHDPLKFLLSFLDTGESHFARLSYVFYSRIAMRYLYFCTYLPLILRFQLVMWHLLETCGENGMPGHSLCVWVKVTR